MFLSNIYFESMRSLDSTGFARQLDSGEHVVVLQFYNVFKLQGLT